LKDNGANMADVLTAEQRKKNMRNIRGKDTKIEMVLRKALWNKGYRYRKNYAALPGKPDIVLTKYKVAIFCDGEFFHGKDWDDLKIKMKKSNNGDFWINKIEKNIYRDREVDRELTSLGWHVVRFWGKEILKNTDECIRVIDEYVFDWKLKNNYIE